MQDLHPGLGPALALTQLRQEFILDDGINLDG